MASCRWLETTTSNRSFALMPRGTIRCSFVPSRILGGHQLRIRQEVALQYGGYRAGATVRFSETVTPALFNVFICEVTCGRCVRLRSYPIRFGLTPAEARLGGALTSRGRLAEITRPMACPSYGARSAEGADAEDRHASSGRPYSPAARVLRNGFPAALANRNVLTTGHPLVCPGPTTLCHLIG